MFPPSAETGSGSGTLALLDHRGADLAALSSRFQDRGWRVVRAQAPEDSARLLREDPPTVALVAPLTLAPDTAEWDALLPHLSPRQDRPWLILPWEGARAGRLAGLLQDPATLADWLAAPFDPAEAEARVHNLLRLQELVRRKNALAEELRSQLIVDHKTDLANDRHFRARLGEEFARSQRHGAPLSLLLLDIDDFKQINDSTTYDFGDQVLAAVAGVIRHSVRGIDLAARIGGDEFGVLMPNTNLEESVGVATRIHSMADGMVVDADGHRTTLHLSIGTAAFEGHGFADGAQLFLRANEALKQAKATGKNRVCFFDPHRRAPSEAAD